MTLPGVGRKTANLVLILGFKSRSNICVDTHVHRISNRLGWVSHEAARGDRAGAVPATDRRWWPYINLYLVTWGQNVCRPVYPRCGDCAIADRLSKNWRAEETGMKGIIGTCIAALVLLAPVNVAAGQTATPQRGRGAAAPAPKPAPAPAPAPAAQGAAGAGPIIVIETATKGSFEIETYPTEAPKNGRAHPRRW